MNELRRVMLVVFCFVSLHAAIAEQQDPIRAFIDSVNTAWTSTNYVQLLQVIDNRLTENPHDILALGVKQSYYIYCDFDVPKAHAAAHAMTNAVHVSGRADIIPVAEEMTRLIFAIPSDTTAEYTQEKRELLHKEFNRYFPGAPEAVDIALKFERSGSKQPSLTIDSMPGKGVQIQLEPKDDFDRGAATTPFVRIYAKGTRATITAPEQDETKAFLKWSSDGTDELATTPEYSFIVSENATVIAVYATH